MWHCQKASECTTILWLNGTSVQTEGGLLMGCFCCVVSVDKVLGFEEQEHHRVTDLKIVLKLFI